MRLWMMSFAMALAACTPTVQVAAPEKPIEINLNVNIEHHIKVEIDQKLDHLFAENASIF